MASNGEQQVALRESAPTSAQGNVPADLKDLAALSQANQAQFMRGFDRYSIIEVGGLPVDYVPKWHYVTEISSKYNWRAIKHNPTIAEQRPVERDDAFPRPESEMNPREKGTLIHKERELAAAVHLIPMPTFLPITREDLFAFNYILKPFRAFKTLITKPWVNRVAEIRLFGCPAGCNIMVTGKVDQIICDWRNDTMFIGDLKTTGLRTVPDSFYQEQTCMQLNLYHRMVDDFVTGNIPMDAVAGIVDFDLQKDFTPHFQQGIEELCGFPLRNMEQLYAFVVGYLTRLPKTFELFIEYVLQSPARETFHETAVVFDEDKLKRRLAEFFVGYACEKEGLDHTDTTSDYGSDMEYSPVKDRNF